VTLVTDEDLFTILQLLDLSEPSSSSEVVADITDEVLSSADCNILLPVYNPTFLPFNFRCSLRLEVRRSRIIRK
jgi:hypothetical protein